MQVRAMAGCLARTSALFVSDERERCVHTHRQKTSRQRESSVATHTALSTSHANGLRFPVSAHDACRTTGERRDGHKYRFQRHAQTAMPTSLTPRSHLAHTSLTPRSHLAHTSLTPRSHMCMPPHTTLTAVRTLRRQHCVLRHGGEHGRVPARRGREGEEEELAECEDYDSPAAGGGAGAGGGY